MASTCTSCKFLQTIQIFCSCSELIGTQPEETGLVHAVNVHFIIGMSFVSFIYFGEYLLLDFLYLVVERIQ